MLTALIGLPRSGKNTFCEKWVLEKENRAWLSRDDVRLVYYGKRFDPTKEKNIQLIYSNSVKTFIRCDSHIHIMLNETNCSVKAVRTVFREYDEKANFIFVNTPPEVCKERAVLTQQEDLIPVIDRMYENLINLCNYYRMENDPIDIVDEDTIKFSIEKIRLEVMGKEVFRKFHHYFKSNLYLELFNSMTRKKD